MTYATIRTRIADELDEGGITSNINEGIQTAIKYYERMPLWFNQKTVTFSTVADQEYYDDSDQADIPNLIEIKSMTGSLSSTKFPIYSADFNSIDAVQNGSVTGMPGSFAYFNEQIRLYPIPNTVYTITAAIVYRLTALSADGDTNAWVTDAEALIRTRAKREICIHKLCNYELADRLWPIEQMELAALLAETRRRRSNKTLKTELGGVPGFDINIG